MVPSGFVLDAEADVAAAPDGFQLDPPAPAARGTPSRFAVNAAEGFRGTLVGEAVERARSGDTAARAAGVYERAMQPVDPDAPEYRPTPRGWSQLVIDPTSPYGQSPEVIAGNAAALREEAARRSADYQGRILPERRAEEAALPPIAGPVDAAVALAGQLAGSVASPESLVGPAGARFARQAGETAGRFVARQAVESGLPNAVIAGAVDPVVQGGQVTRGEREAYSPIDTAFAAVLGGLIGTGLPVGVDAARSIRGAVARLRGVAPDEVAPNSVTSAELAGVEPEVLAAYRAAGMEDAEIRRTLEAFRLADAQRQRVTRSATDVQPGAAPVGEGAPSARLRQDFFARSQGPQAEAVDPGAPLQRRQQGDVAPDTLPRQTFRADAVDPQQFGPANAPSAGALVPMEPQPNRMTPGEIARARAEMQGGNPNTAEPPPRFVAPEGRLPRTADHVAEQRQAADAFRQAEAQRERVAPGIRDTQPAGLPHGEQRMDVLLHQGIPVRVVSDDGGATIVVQRFDPRTGAVESDSQPYPIPRGEMRVASYTPQPRRAQDFVDRAQGPPSPCAGFRRSRRRAALAGNAARSRRSLAA